MRLIDANNLLEEMGAGCMPILEKGISQVTGDESTIKDYIDQAPTVDAEPVRHGRWATDKEDIEWGNSLKRKHCTNCGKRPHFDKEKGEFVLTNYCPHCGAKMDLEA